MFQGMLGVVLAAMMNSGGPEGICRDSLVAHEWGTFTTFAGSDGSPIAFDSGVGLAGDNSLPDWVHGYASTDGRLAAVEATRIKDNYTGLVRMETPVIYFYSPKPTEVDVRVEFKGGIMTEFYPPPTSAQGAVGTREEFKSAASRLVWEKVRVQPESAMSSGDKPRIRDAGKSHYAAARATDADILTVNAGGAPHHEKFLFYRGVADFDAPLLARATGSDAFEITNRSPSPVAAILMEARNGSVRFTTTQARPGATKATLPKEPGNADDLANQLIKLLAEAGLYPKEAHAMVNTWRSSWLAEPGTRVLYLSPRADVDRVLPLDITPVPAKVVRVFVGRAEVLTPETETQVKGLLAKMDASPEDKRDAVMAQVRTLTGRFTHPACERVRAIEKRGATQARR